MKISYLDKVRYSDPGLSGYLMREGLLLAGSGVSAHPEIRRLDLITTP